MTSFSVIICTYNRAAAVAGAIHTVLDQQFTDFELIVVNDGSTDETASTIAEITDSRLRGVNRENGGLSAARNTGIAEAKGTWVVFLDDDDRPEPRWLQALAERTGEEVGLVSCGCHFVDPAGARLRTRMPSPHPVFDDVSGVFLAGAFAVRRELYTAVGGYAESIPTSHQTELILRLVPELRRRGLSTVAINDALVSIESRPPSDRPLSQPEELLIGAEYLITEHGSTLAAAPRVLADYHAVAGVSAVQVGRQALGRQHLLRACKTSGWRPKHLSRLALAAVPPLARRIWGRHYRRAND